MAKKETKDYTGIIPEPPEDLIAWLNKRGALRKNWLIFQCAFYTDPLTGTKTPALNVRCTACGDRFYAPRIANREEIACHAWNRSKYEQYRGIVGETVIEDGQDIKCPHCSKTVSCVHGTRAHRDAVDVAWPLVATRADKALIFTGYRVTRSADKQGVIETKVEKYEACVFDGNKAPVRLTGVERSFYHESYTGRWMQRVRYCDGFGNTPHVYCPAGWTRTLRGTQYANCKMPLFLKKIDPQHRAPIAYLALFRRHPQVENLITQGFWRIVACAIDWPDNCGVNWREKSPRRMLGLEKSDYEIAKRQDQNKVGIKYIKRLRAVLPAVSAEEIANLIHKIPEWQIKIVEKQGKHAARLITYLHRVVSRMEYKNEGAALSDWNDYVDAAKNLHLDLQDPAIRYPRKLKAAHDRAIQAREYSIKKELIEKFAAMTEKLTPLTWTDAGLLIRPAADEEELIVEGKLLKHCVGGYGKSHCEGRTVFFIRKAGNPDAPYFTLNLNIKDKNVIQNRGFQNCAPPPEVTEFVDHWMEQMVKPYDFAGRRSRKPKSKIKAA